MAIPTLPVVFIGWFFAIVSFAALVIGVLLLQYLFRNNKIPAEYLQTRIASDFALLVVWAIGLASSFGLLYGASWGRIGLEYFCWVLVVLVLLSGGSRLASYRRRSQAEALTPRDWLVAAAGVTLVALPILVLCTVAIHSLRAA